MRPPQSLMIRAFIRISIGIMLSLEGWGGGEERAAEPRIYSTRWAPSHEEMERSEGPIEAPLPAKKGGQVPRGERRCMSVPLSVPPSWRSMLASEDLGVKEILGTSPPPHARSAHGLPLQERNPLLREEYAESEDEEEDEAGDGDGPEGVFTMDAWEEEAAQS